MRRAVLSVILAFVAVALATAQNKTIKNVPVQRTVTIEGPELFNQYCATCHGKDGKGNGPAAEALKKRPADLTQIARHNNGKFNDMLVQNVINGEDVTAAHGSREMPIWGEVLKSVTPDSASQRLKVFGLVKYIEQMQAK
jgi:mono/diheme cytochrome c family protein